MNKTISFAFVVAINHVNTEEGVTRLSLNVHIGRGYGSMNTFARKKKEAEMWSRVLWMSHFNIPI